MQHPDWPPLPGDIFNLPVWPLGDGMFALDDRKVNYGKLKSKATAQSAGGFQAMSVGPPSPDPGDTNNYSTNSGGYTPLGGGAPIDKSGLWLEITGCSNGYANLILHGTTNGVEYEILSQPALGNGTNISDWNSEGTFWGSATTNWTAISIAQNNRTNLFFDARSLQDSDGGGLPDWWQMKYFGHTGVDPYADPDGDGWNNLQEFQNGTNPNVFNTPPAPQGVTVTYNPNTGKATVSWVPSPGPVTGYTINFKGTDYFVSAGENELTDVTDATPAPSDDIQVQANYTGGNSAWSASASSEALWVFSTIPGPTNSTYLAASASILPVGTTTVQLKRIDTYAESHGNFSYDTTLDIPISAFTNGLYLIPASFQTAPVDGYGQTNYQWTVQTFSTNQGVASYAFNCTFAIPYYDGRVQLKQNVIFLLRAASQNHPFDFGEQSDNYFYPAENGSGPWIYSFNSPTNYVWASPYRGNNVRTLDNSELFSLYLYEPFDDNYRYLNFVFNTSNLNNDGTLTTGAFASDSDSIGLNNPMYQFNGSLNQLTNAFLSTNSTHWLLYAGLFYDNVIVLSYTDDSSIFSMPANARNFYGLPYLSAKLAYQDDSGDLTIATLSAGNRVSLPLDIASPKTYTETAQPQLQLKEYDFWIPSPFSYEPFPNQDLVPGMPGFATTSQSRLMICPVGWQSLSLPYYALSFHIDGYAKFAIQNGYTNIFAYVGQYFDKAYVVSNNVATTNTTGVLSPYGNFFPTQAGEAALVTMPDLDTGARGTCMVWCASVSVDKNHDGIMDTSFNGPDATSQVNPMEFWVDSDNDGYGVGQDTEIQSTNDYDYNSGRINSQRGLEDFARLWLCGLPKLPSSQGYYAALTCNAISGSPAINIYYAETNGGTEYLTDTNVAQSLVGEGMYGTVSPTSPQVLPPDFFDGTNKYFLFQGAGIGEGQFTLTIYQGTNIIAQTSAYIDLHDVKDFYEQAVVIENTSGAKSNWTSSVETVLPTVSSLGADTNLIVLVHGINVKPWDCVNDAETVCKRLYWAGYQGKFTEVEWPCNLLTPIPSPLSPAVFNDSELQAYKASLAFTNYIGQLRARFPNYRLNILAHSQGNAVVSEAIKRGMSFDTYILTQGALPASAYDANATNDPDLLGHSSTPELQPMGYLCIYTNSNFAGHIINFYNSQDGVLDLWVKDQEYLKPSVYFDTSYYYYDGTNSYFDPLIGANYLVTDPEESRAEVSRSLTLSIGQSGPASAHGVIKSAVDLNANFGFSDAITEHSAQWTRPIQTSRPYFQQVLTSCGIQPAP